MESFRVVALIAATVVMGLMAGVFALYSNTIMPGLVAMPSGLPL